MLQAGFLAAWAAISHSNGGFDCTKNRDAAMLPGSPRKQSDTDTASLACVGRACTLNATTDFKGYVVVGTGAMADACFKHSSNAPKSSYSFVVPGSARAAVYATVVFEKPLYSGHVYATASTSVMADNAHLYIVGAGPGGLAAARYAATLQNVDVTIFERGPMPPDWFYEDIIMKTYSYRSDNPFGSSDTMVGNMVGGTQAINGAVFKPGAPEDLARSLGISLAEAKEVQRLSASYVDTLPLPPDNTSEMMWACIDPNDCDHASVAASNTKMKRRAIGYNFTEEVGDRVNLVVNATVKTVTDTKIAFEGGVPADIEVLDGDAVILAAGALLSPGLIGPPPTQWLNHYYYLELNLSKVVPRKPQSFEYPNGETGSMEINRAALALISNTSSMVPLGIYMDMNLDNLPETLVNGVVTFPPLYQSAHPQWATAWHYHGTMAHGGDMRVVGKQRVYTGDAGALMTSFNCHTSMPAAAAGVAAVRGWAGQQLDPTIKVPTYESADAKHRPAWIVALFLAGSWLMVLGVAAHVAHSAIEGGSEPLKTVHYMFMFIGTVLLAVAIGTVMTAKRSKVGSRPHRLLGWATFGALLAQVVLGSVARRANMAYKKNDKRWLAEHHTIIGKVHRSVGWILVAGIVTLSWSAMQGAHSHGMQKRAMDGNAIALSAVAGLAFAVMMATLISGKALIGSRKTSAVNNFEMLLKTLM